ncbi:MAG TPA: hypothetical protein PL005_03180 [Candidatus Hydrogenedentes bacterium]|nr:hypothetical protein [Candidatus Hydrogenedentota bacterium]
MKKPKIVVIGAGSASFGLSVLGSLLREPGLRGSTLGLVDLNAEGLKQVAALAERLNREWDAGFTVQSSTDRRDLLPDADFVVLSIAVDREKCWQSDYDIALKHGILHYAENGGPGGFIHAARNIAVVMDIFRDMERLCPDAWLVNFTNPMARICTAVHRHTKLRAIGICHQLAFGYMMLGNLLSKDLDIPVPDGYRFVWRDREALAQEKVIAGAAMEKVDVVAAGTNHFTWMLRIREKGSGRDLYPLVMERAAAHDPGFEPLTKEMARIFGVFPVPGDCHMVEYLPYTHNTRRGGWEYYDVQMYPLDGAVTEREVMWERIEAMASGRMSIESMEHVHSERAEKVIAAIATGEPLYEQALNLPNEGQIANLPEGAVVETPAVVGAGGPRGVAVGALPDAVAELVRRQITVVQLAVDAAVLGDRKLALQALALDPMVDDPRVAQALLDDYLAANKTYLPQFGG